MTPELPYNHALDLFGARPWTRLDPTVMSDAAQVPTMLSAEESAFYYWLARDWAQGAGAIVDLGAFLGGSTARLAAGQAEAGRSAAVVAYDNFTASEDLKARLLYTAGIPQFAGEDIFLLAHRLLTRWKPAVELRPGDILEQHWDGTPVELLAVDAAKSAELADHIAAEFFPALLAGRSVVIQQDFLHRVQPWLPAQMTLLHRHFLPLARIARDCMAFLCITPPDAGALAAARVTGLDDPELTRLVRNAANRYHHLAGRHFFARMVRKIAANPEQRVAWKMRRD